MAIRRSVYTIIHSKRASALAWENLGKYYPIVMKFSGYLLLHEETSTVDFKPDRIIPLTGHGPKEKHEEFGCSSVFE